jgi:hypothetical protein
LIGNSQGNYPKSWLCPLYNHWDGQKYQADIG